MTAPFLLPIVLLARLAHPEPAFVRVAETDCGRQLQTSVVEYVHPSGVRVTLVATVHLAEPAYFDTIRQRIDAADVVVHEGVQRRLTKRLVVMPTLPQGLVSQSDRLRCAGERFVVGDLDETAFDASRDAHIPVAPTPPGRPELARSVLLATGDPGTRRATERAFAVHERNAAAIATLKHRLTRGDTSILLVYGASHAPDLDRRLIDDLGFARSGSTWLNAFGFAGADTNITKVE